MDSRPRHTTFLSASVPNRPEWAGDIKPAEIEEAIVCLARAVFARQGRLVFGGHPSISPLIASVAGEYFAVDPRRQFRPVIIFQSEFFRGRLPDETWDLHRLGWAEIVWTPIETRGGFPDLDLSLHTMRRYMLLDPDLAGSTIEGIPWELTIARLGLATPRAMVAIGGMEGVVDESAMFLRYCPQAPVSCFVTTGAAAGRLLGREMSQQTLWPRWAANETVQRNRSEQYFERLLTARRNGRLRAVEDDFRSQFYGAAAELFAQDSLPQFQPYALMAQFLMD
jgi:hypothetical protein